MFNKNTITVEGIINAPIEKIWEFWVAPEHIMNWAFASDDWEAPYAENDIQVGGRFKTTMSAKDKSASFDFTGIYTAIKQNQIIEYDMDKDVNEQVNRHVKIEFIQTPEGVRIVEIFDPENINPIEMQRAGWQAILDNFKKYVEASK